MADDSITILEGPVKFRDGKKWKPRWCVLRRLSPVADAVELALYAESPSGSGGVVGRCKATVSLAGWVGCTMGFPLDRQAHTLALLVAGEGAGAVLAMESRAALLQWVARVEGALGAARRHVVAVVSGAAATAQGTLLLTDRRMALVAGALPCVRAVWELQHLRRFGVVSGRFVWEAGALAGGAAGGVHCAASDDVTRLAEDVRLAARGLLEPRRRTRAATTDGGSPTSMRTSHGTLTRPQQHVDHRSASPAVARDMPRCVSCSAALCLATGAGGAGGTGFSPAWSMPPPRPSRVPTTPYDNYDVPKMPFIEAEGEYYDTPRRLRVHGVSCMSRSLTAGALWGCGAGERETRRDDVSELYAVVDVTMKRRARCDVTHYENGAFVRSLRLYENVLPRASSAEYLPMRPRAPPPLHAAGYARMAPAARRRRAASDSLLVDEEAPWGGSHTARGGNRDSSSSGDSGVGGCEAGRLRRCRSCELALSPRAAPTNGSTSAEAAVPLHPRARSRTCDTRSTSSGASDLSDYMETLSMSSHSSTDAHRLGGAGAGWLGGGAGGASGGVHTLLRPRSGREYARGLHLPPHAPQPPLPPRALRAPRQPNA